MSESAQLISDAQLGEYELLISLSPGYPTLIEEVSPDEVQEDAWESFLILSEKLNAHKVETSQLHETATVARVPRPLTPRGWRTGYPIREVRTS